MIIYPEDEGKPPVGSGLNRRAVVTLERVWPRDKTERRPVTEPDRYSTPSRCKLKRDWRRLMMTDRQVTEDGLRGQAEAGV